MAVAGFGFWYVVQSLDERQTYVIATRTIEPWEVLTGGDLTTVQANLGDAAAMTPAQARSLFGQWAVGRIPEGTLITPGMFQQPPLSSDAEADSIILQLALPAGEAPFGTLEPGDTVAMIGRENPVGAAATGETDGSQAPLSLIGILRLERMQGGSFYYILPPSEALRLKHTVSRYTSATDRELWKLGASITPEIIQQALRRAEQPGALTRAGIAASASRTQRCCIPTDALAKGALALGVGGSATVDERRIHMAPQPAAAPPHWATCGNQTRCLQPKGTRRPQDIDHLSLGQSESSGFDSVVTC